MGRRAPRLVKGSLAPARNYLVVEHDPAWFAAARREMRRIRSVLGAVAVEVHHIGSTSIPGILAKPVIDLCLEVRGLSELDGQEAAMGALGYEALGEYGIPRRRFFLRNDEAGVGTHHVHAFAAGDSEPGCAESVLEAGLELLSGGLGSADDLDV